MTEHKSANGGGAEQAHAASERRKRRTVANLAIGAIKAQHAAYRSPLERFVDRLNSIAGSTPFLMVHVVWFVIWIPWNTGLLGLKKFDPYPFGFLTMVVSLEAIFLSIFVLMAQQRESAIAELHHMLQPLDVKGIERDLLEQIEAATAARHNPMLDD